VAISETCRVFQLITVTLILITATDLQAEETLCYKKAEERELSLLINKPADWRVADKRPAIVFFFGGGWVGGNATQFQKQSEYLATRGMVGVRVRYRIIPQGDEGLPSVCRADAKSTMRYVRAHASEIKADKFLASLGWMTGEPTLKAPVE